MSLVDHVRRTIRRFDLATADTRVVAAVSGGPDSVALVHLLCDLATAGRLRLVALAHLNHQIRTEADVDEQFCASLAASVALPFAVERVDVPALARAERRSIEDAAHVARYRFFERARQAHQADVVALGHTADDQAETFLLRLLRGAGSRGLGSMHPRSGVVIRPLLDCRRHEVQAFLDARRIPFVRDASNDDLSIPRNRIRAELIPLLERRFNPSVVEVLAREAEIARAEDECLDEVASAWWKTQAKPVVAGWAFDGHAFAALPLAVARRVLQRGLAEAASRRGPSFQFVERARAVALGRSSRADGPGCRVQRLGDSVVLMSRPAAAAGSRAASGPPVPPFAYALPIPGEARVGELKCVVSAEVGTAGSVDNVEAGATAVVSLNRVGRGPLVVRNRRPGDRLRPTAAGSRKLQDILVDRKVPREQRDRIPIVVDSGGRVVWVAGYAVDQEFRVTDPAQAVVILRLKAVGGSF